MELANILKHPFFKGIVPEEDNDYKKGMEAIKTEQEELNRRLDNMLATVDGEHKWMLIKVAKDAKDESDT